MPGGAWSPPAGVPPAAAGPAPPPPPRGRPVEGKKGPRRAPRAVPRRGAAVPAEFGEGKSAARETEPARGGPSAVPEAAHLAAPEQGGGRRVFGETKDMVHSILRIRNPISRITCCVDFRCFGILILRSDVCPNRTLSKVSWVAPRHVGWYSYPGGSLMVSQSSANYKTGTVWTTAERFIRPIHEVRIRKTWSSTQADLFKGVNSSWTTAQGGPQISRPRNSSPRGFLLLESCVLKPPN